MSFKLCAGEKKFCKCVWIVTVGSVIDLVAKVSLVLCIYHLEQDQWKSWNSLSESQVCIEQPPSARPCACWWRYNVYKIMVQMIVPHWPTDWNQDVFKGKCSEFFLGGRRKDQLSEVKRGDLVWAGALGRWTMPTEPGRHRHQCGVFSTCLQSCVDEWREGGSWRWACK